MTPDKFTIEARSCTLLSDNAQKPGLLGAQQYVIPVYQRPYSWGKEEVRRILKGIIAAYQNEQEPYFLGTMQLMPKQDGNGQAYWEIVDGQQRLTTLLLLFKVVQLQYGAVLLPEQLQTPNWLSTRVSNGEQQQWMEEAVQAAALPARPEDGGQNRYLVNSAHIAETLRQFANPEDATKALVVDAAFLNYVLGQLYVVVIETQAGLAKTLDIFNTINTAGMDLNGGDVFKIQLFEYLTRKLGQPDSVFNDIDALYAAIDARNKQAGYQVTSIQEILEIYKYILIERQESSRALHDLGTTTFYERLFACLLLNESPRNFDRKKMLSALGSDPLADLNRLIEVRYVWEDGFSVRHNVWYHLLTHHTRYGWRYWVLDIVYLFRFYEQPGWDKQQFEEWNQLLVRYYMVKTIQFRRVVNEAHTFTQQVIRRILRSETTPVELSQMVRKQLEGHNRPWFRDNLLGDVFDNVKQRNLIFWLLAMLEEEDWNQDAVLTQFFRSEDYDIEHIRPRNPAEANELDDQAWAGKLNRLGNLILLERGLNRSGEVSNYHFAHKWAGYSGSNLKQVQRLRDDNADQTWTLDKCEARTTTQADKLMSFLFAGCELSQN